MVVVADTGAPEEVRLWFESKPDWLIVAAPDNSDDLRLAHLDAGEREAISLALELRADPVLIDERDGRAAALACGLQVAGTLRVLADSAAKGVIDLAEAFRRLRSTSFRADPRLMDLLLKERRKD